MRTAIVALSLTLATSTLTAQDRTVASFAGSGEFGYADGAASIAAFGYPSAVCRTSDGAIIVADPVNQTIRRVDASGVSTLAGVAGVRGSADGRASEATFEFPQGVACRGMSVFVADSGNATVRLIENGFVQTIAGAAKEFGTTDGAVSKARFIFPVAVDVDVDGTLYVVDRSAHTLRRLSTNGEVVTYAGAGGFPGYVDGKGARARFAEPSDIAIDARGFIYVTDSGNRVIREIDPHGGVTTFAGLPGIAGTTDGDVTAARFTEPVGIAAAADGSLLIVDRGGHTIRLIERGEVVTVAGSAGTLGYIDGSATSARFNYPAAVTLAPDGTLYVADMMNQRIRSIAPAEVKSARRRSVRP